MKRGYCILPVILFFLMSLSGCQAKVNGDDKKEGMDHIDANNENGYYFDVYSDESKDKERNGIISIENCSEPLYFKVENVGQKRKMAIQIFIDYVQVPILVDNEEYFTYFIDADEQFSKEFCFRLRDQISEDTNHKLMAVMTASADIYAIDVDGKITSDAYSIAYDMILELSNSNEKIVVDESYHYEETRDVYEDMWEGLIINADLENYKRAFPPKSIEVKSGEEIQLQYHVGGYHDCSEVLIVLSLAMEQVQVNHQEFLRCQVADGKISNGLLKIKAPTEAGLYDVTGWVIKDPFSQSAPQYFPLSATPRFTIKVSP